MSKPNAPRSDPYEDRLVTLEMRIAYQDRLLEELSSVIADQNRHIDDLTLKLREMARQIEPLFSAEKGIEPKDDEKPPHY